MGAHAMLYRERDKQGIADAEDLAASAHGRLSKRAQFNEPMQQVPI